MPFIWVITGAIISFWYSLFTSVLNRNIFSDINNPNDNNSYINEIISNVDSSNKSNRNIIQSIVKRDESNELNKNLSLIPEKYNKLLNDINELELFLFINFIILFIW